MRLPDPCETVFRDHRALLFMLQVVGGLVQQFFAGAVGDIVPALRKEQLQIPLVGG